MKTELKSAFFKSNVLLCEFVNKNHITKENIQAIVEVDGCCVLFLLGDYGMSYIIHGKD